TEASGRAELGGVGPAAPGVSDAGVADRGAAGGAGAVAPAGSGGAFGSLADCAAGFGAVAPGSARASATHAPVRASARIAARARDLTGRTKPRGRGAVKGPRARSVLALY